MLLGLVFPVKAAQHDATSRYYEFLKCGHSALYLLLTLQGQDVDYSQIETIPVTGEGASLGDLCKTTRRFGVQSSVRKFDVNDVDTVPLPAILQVKNSGTWLTQYHFDVLYRVDNKRFYVLDGTTGAVISGLKSRLPNFWTGYALTSNDGTTRLSQLHLEAIFLSLFNITAVLILSYLTKTRVDALC